MPYDKVLQENIKLSNLEKKVVGLEEFQRLKLIKQNGFAYLVYPDSRNNRFDHSIGTMYWATHLFNSIKSEQPSLEDIDLKAIRVAALIHDIGHGPFSHVFEMFFDRNPEFYEFEPWSGLIKKFGFKSPHELLTLNFINSKIFKDLLPTKIGGKIYEIVSKQSPLSLLLSGDLDAELAS